MADSRKRNLWQNPSSPQTLYTWAGRLIDILRKGDFIDTGTGLAFSGGVLSASLGKGLVADTDGALTLSLGLGQCRLDYVGTTSIKLSRFNGKYILINGVLEEIPSAGVTLANTGLTASTLRYIYAYMSSGTMTLEASATAYATASTYGHPIKSGDATRTLVGMVYMDAGTPGTFADTATQRWVISYWNRKAATVTITKGSSTAIAFTPFGEITTSLRTSFLHWGDEPIAVQSQAVASHGTANVAMYYRVAFGVAVGTYATGSAAAHYGVSAAANYVTNLNRSDAYAPAAGFNTATAHGGADSGTVTYASGYHGYTLAVRK